jgi:hypothetical protein
VTLKGAINVMQRPGTGSVVLNIGHKVFAFRDGNAVGPRRT